MADYRILLREVCQTPLVRGIKGVNTIGIIVLASQDDRLFLIFRKSLALLVLSFSANESRPCDLRAALGSVLSIERFPRASTERSRGGCTCVPTRGRGVRTR